MKFGLIVVIALVLSALAAHVLLQDPGYVVINFRGYLVEMSVPVLLAIVALIVIGAWLAVKVFRAPRRLGEAAGRYRTGRAGQRLTRGMIEIAEGNFSKGEKLLARAANVSDSPLLNYLQAARAAHLLGETERRDTWLKQAYEQTPAAANAVLLTQAELQLDEGQYEQALATLRQLEENSPNHARALVLLGRLYFKLQDWDQLAGMLPRLRKHGKLEAAILKDWSLRVHENKLQRAADIEVLSDAWQGVPKDLKKDPVALVAWFEGLIRTGMHDQASKELARELKREWREPLVRLFGVVESSDRAAQLKRAESWLKDHADDAELERRRLLAALQRRA